jgi:hypothetical protein
MSLRIQTNTGTLSGDLAQVELLMNDGQPMAAISLVTTVLARTLAYMQESDPDLRDGSDWSYWGV